TFDIDANGILNVSAEDKATGKEQQITITATTNLTEEEVEELVKEAKRHEAKDRKQQELVKARNQADQVVYQTEKALRELGDQVSESDRSRIEDSIEELKEATQGDDSARIRRLIEQLQHASMALGQQMYAQQQQQAGGPTPGAGPKSGPGDEPPSGDEDVIEGEFEEA
ncbi:MAG: Hsp70 family protein, partial [Anaerolineae bacterium]